STCASCRSDIHTVNEAKTSPARNDVIDPKETSRRLAVVRYSTRGGALRRSRGGRVHHAVMVSHRVAGVGIRRRPRPFLQHSAVPCLPAAFESIKHVLAAVLQIGALARVLNHVKQKLVPCDPQVLPVAVADSPLRSGLIAPIELARMRSCAGQRWSQI